MEMMLSKFLNVLRKFQSMSEKKRPYFVEFDTYRWLEHCGPNLDNNIGYRSEKEFKIWKKKTPFNFKR